MDTLLTISTASQRKGPYPKGLRAKIVAIKKEEDGAWIIGLADNTAAFKAICYSAKTAAKLVKEENNTLLFRNFSRGRFCIIIKENTMFMRALPISVPTHLETKAQNIVSPPEPSLTPLGQVKPSDVPITVEGNIVQVS